MTLEQVMDLELEPLPKSRLIKVLVEESHDTLQNTSYSSSNSTRRSLTAVRKKISTFFLRF